MSFQSYQGSKIKDLPFIIQYQPKTFNKVIDVFGGGGSISYHYLMQGYKVVFNDVDKNVYEYMKMIKNDEYKAFMKKIKPITEEEFKTLKEKENKSLLERFIVNANSFKGIGLLYGKRKLKDGTYKTEFRNIFNPKRLKLLDDIKDKLKNLEIHNEDYKKILEKYKNNKNAFVYLDPPYLTKGMNGYDAVFTTTDIDYIINFMKTCKCKVMLHVDLSGHTLLNLKDMLRHMYPKNYDLKNGIKDKTKNYGNYISIFTNYK